MQHIDEEVAIMVQPYFNRAASQVQSLQVRYNFQSGAVKDALQITAKVVIELHSPFSLVMSIGDNFRHELKLPLPLDHAEGKTKIARKSLWIEYIAPVAKHSMLAARPDSVFPMYRDEQYVTNGGSTARLLTHHRTTLVLENLHYLSPDVLPKVFVGKNNSQANWVLHCTRLETSTSAEEYAEQKRTGTYSTTSKSGRLSVKETISMMFMHIFGFRGLGMLESFALRKDNSGFAHIYVDAVRMDVSNQTVFLDSALVLLDHGNIVEYSKEAFKVCPDSKIVAINTDENEEPFRRNLLPTFSERCRSWQHKATCEYNKTGANMPLSTKSYEKSMCSCGLDVFPVGYLKKLKNFKAISKYAVRVAIPVIYASPVSSDGGDATQTANISSKPTTSARQTSGPCLEDLDAKKDTCFACGAKKGKASTGALLNCAGCHFAQYCSKECQVKDWKQGHKSVCKQLKASQE